MEDLKPLTIVYWNKVDVDNLTLEINRKDDKMFFRVYTNDVNVLNKKVEIDETLKIKIDRIFELANEVSDNYFGDNKEEFKKLSGELMQQIGVL